MSLGTSSALFVSMSYFNILPSYSSNKMYLSVFALIKAETSVVPFNTGENPFDDISVVIKPMPLKIYEIYKDISEKIKRGE